MKCDEPQGMKNELQMDYHYIFEHKNK